VSDSNKKSAIVTGGAVNLGKEICLSLARKGYDIALLYNSSDKGAEYAKKEIEALGVKCETFQHDLTDSSNLKPLIDEIFNKLPHTNLLINNASIFDRVSMLETDEKLFDDNINIHLKAPFFLSKYFAVKAKKGQVINIIDAKISQGYSPYFAYMLSKKALSELTIMAAKELAPNVRVNALAPDTMESSKGDSDGTPIKTEDVIKELFKIIKNDNLVGEVIFISNNPLKEAII